MVRMIQPKPFFLKGGTKAVLLLHSFTSNPRDVRQLGRFLNKEGYTCFAPVYEGHGLSPEQLIETGPSDWWKNVEEGYHFLKKEGCESIAVIGVSLGGLFALKMAQTFDVNSVVVMSVPYKKEVEALKRRFFSYAKAYKQLEGKEEQEISNEIKALETVSFESLFLFQAHITQTMKDLEKIHIPISIMYGDLDEPLYNKSAAYIYQHVSTRHKQMKGYPHSKHLMTLEKDQSSIHSDILLFLDKAPW